MHRCLRIAEVVGAITDYVTEEPDQLCMALTCRAFYDSAMDALWRRPCPDNLFLCLPAHTRGEGAEIYVRAFPYHRAAPT